MLVTFIGDASEEPAYMIDVEVIEMSDASKGTI